MFKRIRRKLSVYNALLSDVRTPVRAKILPIVAVLYLISPIDFIPDILPVIGQMDDVTLIVTLLWMAIRAIPKPLYREYEKKQKEERVIDITPGK